MNPPMTTDKRKALGRGLETLLPPRQVPHAPVAAPPAAPKTNADEVHQLALDHLEHNPYQTRTLSLDPSALGNSRLPSKRWEWCSLSWCVPSPADAIRSSPANAVGRRPAASGMATIPAIVRQVSNEQAMEMTIIENLQREDLNAMEQARGLRTLVREFGLTQEQMAQRTGKERSSVANFMRLLKLPSGVQTMVEKGQLSFGHAKALMPLDSPEAMERLAQRVAELRHVGPADRGGRCQPGAAAGGAAGERARRRSQREGSGEMLERSLGVRVTINDRKARARS